MDRRTDTDIFGDQITNFYAHNGKGERVAKTVGGATTTFVYREGGQPLGEYTPSLQQEYIYLDVLLLARRQLAMLHRVQVF